jgi:hypothetical protein
MPSTRDTTLEQSACCILGTHASADLKPQARPARQFHDFHAIAEFAVTRTIEVDDMQPGRSKIAITRGELCRIMVVDRLSSKVTL